MERDAKVVRKGVSVRLGQDRPQPHEPSFKPLTKLIMRGIARRFQMTKSPFYNHSMWPDNLLRSLSLAHFRQY